MRPDKKETGIAALGCGGLLLSIIVYLALIAGIVWIGASIVHSVFM